MATLESRLRTAPDVLFRDLGREGVLLDLASGSYFGLDEVGTRIWQLVAGGETLAAALAVLAAEYDAPEEKVCEDLLRLVDELLESRLLVVAEP